MCSPYSSLANTSSTPRRSAMVTPLSITRPSIWLKMGECVASTSSERYTRPGEMMRMGGFWLSMVRTCTGEVWVRSTMSSFT